MEKQRTKKIKFSKANIVALGTFSTDYMESEAREVFDSHVALNAVNYPDRDAINEITDYCGKFILSLLNGLKPKDYLHFNTSGSSEAVFLAVLLLKRYWQTHLEGKGKPNIILSASSHIAWYKAAFYLDVDTKIVSLDKESLMADFSNLDKLIDQNTIGICCTLGAPTTLVFDDVYECNKIAEDYYQATSHFVPIHVDAASGGFVAPFVFPELKWDFDLEHVLSINASSHKYGLVYPALGWLLLDKRLYCETYTHESNYHGVPSRRFTITFSQSAAHLFTQYYLFKSLKYEGYKNIITNICKLATDLQEKLADLKEVRIIPSAKVNRLPGIIFSLNSATTKLDMKTLSFKLKEKGWGLPVCDIPGLVDNQQVGKVVIRYGFTQELINKLFEDIKESLK